MTDWAGDKSLPRRAPNAAWAWEGLRRNPHYRRAYFSSPYRQQRAIQLHTGASLLRLRARQRKAEAFGLLAFADPRKAAVDADVFWCPDLFLGCLDVRLSQLNAEEFDADSDVGIIQLHRLQTRRLLLETADGARHIVLNGHRFWIQMLCEKPKAIGDTAHLGIRFNRTENMQRSLDSAAQLLSLYRSEGGKLGLIGRRKNTETLRRALIAYDVWTGFERPRGTLRDIACAIVGEDRVKEDWTGPSRCLKDMARRARDKGIAFVQHDYLNLLNKSAL